MPEPGTPLVRFDDGSGIVVGDGSPAEAEALRALLRQQVDDEEKADGIARSVLAAGCTFARSVPADTPAMSGEMFEAIAEARSPN